MLQGAPYFRHHLEIMADKGVAAMEDVIQVHHFDQIKAQNEFDIVMTLMTYTLHICTTSLAA